MRRLLLFLFFTLSTLTQAQTLLPADNAFGLSVKLVNDKIVLNWAIAKDHYLLKNKIKIAANTPQQLGAIEYPTALIRNDAFFGKIKVYNDNVAINIPVLKGDAKSILLTISYLGCTDVLDICYPLITKTASLDISAVNSNVTDKPSLINSALTMFNNATNQAKSAFKNLIPDTNEPLNPEQAFKISVIALNANTLQATWQIEKDYYLYHNKFLFDIKGADFDDFQFPKGKIKDDEFYGKVEVHKKQLNVAIPLKNITAETVAFNVQYQGCWEGGVCYPPQNKTFNIVLPARLPSAAANPSKGLTSFLPSSSADTVEINETDRIAALFKQDTLWLVLLSFFGFGLLLSLTPCVFPMIPILSGIIIGQKSSVPVKRALLMSVIFVFAMSITYAGAGVAVGYFGQNLQILFQTPWVIMLFSGVFVVLAFSMFGYYDIQLPARFQKNISSISNKQKNGSLFGVFIMGFLSALIVGPCVAPPLAGALIYIGQTGDALLGGLSLFVMSLGIGVPLILIGTGVSTLPKAGEWMEKVKHIFGILMLAVAIYLLDRIISPFASMILWATLITLSPIALGALKPLHINSSVWQSIFKGLGLIMLGYGVLIWLLIARGGGDMLQPLSGWGVQNATNSPAHLRFTSVQSSNELDQILAKGAQNKQIVMLDFYADWCIACKELERSVFANAKVISAMQNIITLQADVTKNNSNDKALMKRFNIVGPPAILFFKNHKEIRSKRIIGEVSGSQFLAHIDNLSY